MMYNGNTLVQFKNMYETRKVFNIKDYDNMRKNLQLFGIDYFIENERNNDEYKLFEDNMINSKIFTFFNLFKFANKEDQEIIPINNKSKYIILRNKQENGGFPDSGVNVAFFGATKEQSMSNNHQFLAINDNNWSLFNALTFGMDKEWNKKNNIIKILNEMKEITLLWADKRNIPYENLECFFHIYPMNSIHSLHLHMIDITKGQINYTAYNYHGPKGGKCITLDDLILYFSNHM